MSGNVPETPKVAEREDEAPTEQPPWPIGVRLWIGLGVVLAIVAIGAAYLLFRGPGSAAAELTSAVQSGDDITVVKMLVPSLQTGLLGGRTEGAAQAVSSSFPSLDSMELRKVSSSEAWLLDPDSPDLRLVFKKGDGWQVTSASYITTETVDEPLVFPEAVNETNHLPAGTRIVIEASQPGTVRRTVRVLKRDGTEVSRTEANREVLTQPTAGEVYQGTGKKGSGVTRLRTGSRVDKKAYRVTNNRSTVGAPGTLATSWRIPNPKSGDRTRCIELGPQQYTSESDNTKMSSGYDWYDFYSSIELTEYDAGRWIVVIERNNRPAVWKVVTAR